METVRLCVAFPFLLVGHSLVIVGLWLAGLPDAEWR